jgi:hypothetical protein
MSGALWSRISAIWRGTQWIIGENHIVGPARRWAAALDAGGLVFVDSDQLVTE